MYLSKKWIDKLKALPETGMGCQVVDIHLKHGAVHKGIVVLNCEIIMDNVPFSENDILDIKLHT